MTLDDFVGQGAAVAAGLVRVEVLALRLYTGKGYWLINTSCRAATPAFAVTAFVTNKAIGKLAASQGDATPSMLYRGMRGQLQPWFTGMYRRGEADFSAVAIGRLADGALMSTTANLEVATGPYGGDVVFVIAKGEVCAPPLAQGMPLARVVLAGRMLQLVRDYLRSTVEMPAGGHAWGRHGRCCCSCCCFCCCCFCYCSCFNVRLNVAGGGMWPTWQTRRR